QAGDAVAPRADGRGRRDPLEPAIDRMLAELDIEQGDLMAGDIRDRRRLSVGLAIGFAGIDRPGRGGDPARDQRVLTRLGTADGDIRLAFGEIEKLVA